MRVQEPNAVAIDIWSDVVCPWCWIGRRRLERAVAERKDLAVRIRWRAFLLNPSMPPSGMDRQAYLEAKFGGSEGARSVYARIEAAGITEGLPFRFDLIRRMPSTWDAHRLLYWAGTVGGQDSLSVAFFEAFFSRGADLGNPGALLEAAVGSGLDGAAAEAVLDSGRFRQEVEAEDRALRNAGGSGVPLFVFAERLAVSGAERPEVFLQVLEQLCGAANPLPA